MLHILEANNIAADELYQSTTCVQLKKTNHGLESLGAAVNAYLLIQPIFMKTSLEFQ